MGRRENVGSSFLKSADSYILVPSESFFGEPLAELSARSVSVWNVPDRSPGVHSLHHRSLGEGIHFFNKPDSAVMKSWRW